MKAGIQFYEEKRAELVEKITALTIDLERARRIQKIEELKTGEKKRVFIGIKSLEAQIKYFEKELFLTTRSEKNSCLRILNWHERKKNLEAEIKNCSEQIEYIKAKTEQILSVKDSGFSLKDSEAEYFINAPKTLKTLRQLLSLYENNLVKHTRLRPRESLDYAKEMLKLLAEYENIKVEIRDDNDLDFTDREKIEQGNILLQSAEMQAIVSTAKDFQNKSKDVIKLDTDVSIDMLRSSEIDHEHDPTSSTEIKTFDFDALMNQPLTKVNIDE